MHREYYPASWSYYEITDDTGRAIFHKNFANLKRYEKYDKTQYWKKIGSRIIFELIQRKLEFSVQAEKYLRRLHFSHVGCKER